ncbi:MAG: DUF4292 domain-containing protein [Flavobacteriaceae bacterium]|nr:DUF4292 domain-containing protein [Flavobacteriaceae bacterium]
MRYIRLFMIALLALHLGACGGAKGLEGRTTAKKGVAVKSLIASHEAAAPQFSTLAARVQVEYKDDKTSQSITTSLRIEKDKTIWIKASILGITLAKVLITEDRVAFYETINNAYFDGDFALLSDMLGTEINFEKAQNILLGQSIFNLKDNSYTSEVLNNQYRLTPKKEFEQFMHAIMLYPKSYKIASEMISQPDENRQLTINYGPYELTEGQYFPSDVQINASDGESATYIDLRYKKIDLNVSISFPFRIPEGYDQMTLKR